MVQVSKSSLGTVHRDGLPSKVVVQTWLVRLDIAYRPTRLPENKAITEGGPKRDIVKAFQG